jgi:gluconate 2-dehydrogenase
MSKPKVYIGQKIPIEIETYIAQYCDYEMWQDSGKVPESVLYEKVQDVDGLLLSGIQINEALLNHAPKLKAVSNISVGYSNYDIMAMKKHSIIGTHTPGSLDDTVADLIFALILSSARRITEMDRYMRAGLWQAEDEKILLGKDVHHCTIGIIGMGRIGELVAKRAKLGFEMNVLYHNRNRKPKVEKNLGAIYTTMPELLQQSDFVVLMAPLTEETYHMIDHKAFEMMKNDAFFINASRGHLVNEADLIIALKTHMISGAGLDVYECEPIEEDNPLLSLSNVVAVPHIGSATEKTRYKMVMQAAENLVAAMMGNTPKDIVPELRN